MSTSRHYAECIINQAMSLVVCLTGPFLKYPYHLCYAIRELRKLVLPEIRELVHQQRLNYLMAGARFAKYSKEGKCKGKDQRLSWRTSLKVLLPFFLK